MTDKEIVDKLTELTDGTINHFDLDDAMDLLYEIKRILSRRSGDKKRRILGMTREDMYMLGCLFAVDRLMEKSGVAFRIKVNGKQEMVPWAEIKEWIEKQYGIEKKVEE